MSVLNTRPLIGWQTLLADLSLILFMVTAAAMADSTPGKGPRPVPPPPLSVSAVEAASPRSEPIAVWRAGGGAPPLQQWLRDQQPDSRQQLTIAIHYSAVPGAMPAALAQASALGREAEVAGMAARVLVEPGVNEVVATLSYDRAGLANELALRPAGTGIAVQGR